VTGPAGADQVMDELLLRELTPAVIGVLVRRGADFATAEDAVQEALIQAALTWPGRPPADPKGWLVTVAWRKFLYVDLAAEAIRLTRQLAAMTDDEETAGLLALMLLHHARRPARTRRDGSLVPLAEQDRSRWNTALIVESVAVLQTALGRDRLGEFQAQAAIAALDPGLPRHTAASAYLHEKAGDLQTAARLYADAARSAPNLAERHHLTRQAARISQALRG
jgi:predicted RNA polymerase sigma factor